MLSDYRAQGQTIGHVLVDIATPPTGGLNLFNLYVALSRSSGREMIQLMRDFDQKHFQAAHTPELTREDD
jgi:ATP-dependent exoDNAse (exonuclease V) alpha subunit